MLIRILVGHGVCIIKYAPIINGADREIRTLADGLEDHNATITPHPRYLVPSRRVERRSCVLQTRARTVFANWALVAGPIIEIGRKRLWASSGTLASPLSWSAFRVSNPAVAVIYSFRALIRRTRSPEPTPCIWSGLGESNPVILHGKEGRKPSRTSRILVEKEGVEPSKPLCKSSVAPARIPVMLLPIHRLKEQKSPWKQGPDLPLS